MRTGYKVLGAVAILSAVLLYGTSNFGGNNGTATAAANEATGKPQKNAINLVAPSLPESGKDLSVTSINLSERNTVVYRSDVSAISAARLQNEVLKKSRNLPKGAPLYLVLDTPGGDIMAGNQFIDLAKSLGRPVHTITIFAASMGFNIAQRLDTRYILPSGTLMAHRAYVAGVEGQIPGEFLTAAATLYRLVTKMEKQNAQRLGISPEEYTALVKDEYWVDGEDAVRQGAADRLVSLQCDSSLDGSYYETVMTFFGPVTLEWAKCPAVTAPLGFKFDGPEDSRREISDSLQNFQRFRKLMRAQP
jgi:ATP-dependent protease ClpP protease subunit